MTCSTTDPLFCLEWGHCKLTAQGCDFLSNKQIKPQICCRCTLTGAIHFLSDIQTGRTGNHNGLFTQRSFCATPTSPCRLLGSCNNYELLRGVVPRGGGGVCWNDWRCWCYLLKGTLEEVIVIGDVAHQRISNIQIKENTNTLYFWDSFAYICRRYTLSLRWIKLLNCKFNLLQHWTTGRLLGRKWSVFFPWCCHQRNVTGASVLLAAREPHKYVSVTG